jgi:hypothetical protein
MYKCGMSENEKAAHLRVGEMTCFDPDKFLLITIIKCLEVLGQTH